MKTYEILPRAPGAYRICDQLGNVLYVGSTKNLHRRYFQHVYGFRTKTHKYQQLLEMLQDNPICLSFTFTIAKDREQAYDLEQKDLDQFYGNGILLNRSDVARGVEITKTVSVATRKMISQKLTGRIEPNAVRMKKSEARIAFRHAPEVIEKIRLAHRDKDRPWLHREHSNEERSKRSASLKGRTFSDEHRRNISLARKRMLSNKIA